MTVMTNARQSGQLEVWVVTTPWVRPGEPVVSVEVEIKKPHDTPLVVWDKTIHMVASVKLVAMTLGTTTTTEWVVDVQIDRREGEWCTNKQLKRLLTLVGVSSPPNLATLDLNVDTMTRITMTTTRITPAAARRRNPPWAS